ncbi:MAG: murein biosynthesis integral membrane protein MurJ, partial [Candidatus Binatia bacterium]
DLARRGEDEAWRNTSVLLNNLTLLFLALVALGWFLAPWLARLVGLGFDDATAELSSSLTRILLVGVVLVGAATFLSQLWHSYAAFVAPGLAGIAANLGMAAGIVILAHGWGVYGLAIAVVIGNVAQLVIQLPIVWRHRHAYEMRVDFRHPGMREMWDLSLPVFVSTGGFQIDRLTDRFFASLLPAGSLTSLVFARLLAAFPEKILFKPFQKTTFPHFTRLIAEEKTAALSRQLFQYIRLLVFLSVPAAAGMILLGDVVVEVVYQRGAFDDRAVQLTTQALGWYAVGLPAAFVGHALSNTFIGLKNTKTVMRLSLFRIGVKIALSFALIPVLSHGGIALAESISHMLRTALLFWRLPSEIRARETWATARSIAGTFVATGVMVMAIMGLRTTSDGALNMIAELAFLVPLGAGVYFATSWLARQAEVEWIGRSLTAIARR